MSQDTKRGWIVTFSGTGINLALGVLYTWSVISKRIPEEWGWTEADRALPYTIACLVFAFVMVPAGKMQDRWGPRLTASLGGVLTGAGLIIASLAAVFIDADMTTGNRLITLSIFILGFGVLAGSGFGFGYAAATPPAIKWFPAAKTGMIAGIVVSGFGLASVYIAPLAKYLIGAKGLSGAMFILGVAFLVVVVALSQLLVNPPPAQGDEKAAAAGAADASAGEMLKSGKFYLLWFMYAFNAGAGLMVIGKLAKLVAVQADFTAGFILVALLAIGNAGGRLLAGTLSDKIGRVRTLQAFTAFQCLLMFLMPSMDNYVILIVMAMCIGMNYGSNLALFPSFTKDYFGLKNFGVNYGLVFTAWGVGSIMALVAGKVYDLTKNAEGVGSFQLAFFIAGALLVLTLVLSLVVAKNDAKAQQA